MNLQAMVTEPEKMSFSKENNSCEKRKIIDRLVKRFSKDGVFWSGKDHFVTMPCFKQFAGNGDSLGSGFWYNTSGATFQMMKTLSMLKHPVLNDFIERISYSVSILPEEIDVAPLIQNRILRDFKIMDLGCGIHPSYANCVYSLGADVYTADNNPPENMHFIDKSMKQRHTKVDFNDQKSVEILSTATGGNFDFVTCAAVIPVSKYHVDGAIKIEIPLDERLEEIGLSLLKAGGFFYNTEGSLTEKK